MFLSSLTLLHVISMYCCALQSYLLLLSKYSDSDVLTFLIIQESLKLFLYIQNNNRFTSFNCNFFYKIPFNKGPLYSIDNKKFFFLAVTWLFHINLLNKHNT